MMVAKSMRDILLSGTVGAAIGALVGGFTAYANIRNADLENQKFFLQLETLRKVYADISDPELSARELKKLQRIVEVGAEAYLKEQISTDLNEKGRLIQERLDASNAEALAAVIAKQIEAAALATKEQSIDSVAKAEATKRILGVGDGRICFNDPCTNWIIP